MIDRGRHNVLGVQINAVDYEAAVGRIVTAAREQQPCGVSALAVHGVMTGVLDAEHRHRLNHLDLVVPDGQPVRWALNVLHRSRLPERVYGPRLMLETCRRAADDKLPVFLFGGDQTLLDRLQSKLHERFPELPIAGVRASRFRQLSSEERDELVQEIRDSGARITFVGLGCPRQEVWAYELRNALSMPLIAVGAAFNFHAGLLAQAPPLLQKFGLEWAYRLFHEPRRLWRRYLYLNPLYVTLIVAQLIGARSFSTEQTQLPQQELRFG